MGYWRENDRSDNGYVTAAGDNARWTYDQEADYQTMKGTARFYIEDARQARINYFSDKQSTDPDEAWRRDEDWLKRQWQDYQVRLENSIGYMQIVISWGLFLRQST